MHMVEVDRNHGERPTVRSAGTTPDRAERVGAVYEIHVASAEQDTRGDVGHHRTTEGDQACSMNSRGAPEPELAIDHTSLSPGCSMRGKP